MRIAYLAVAVGLPFLLVTAGCGKTSSNQAPVSGEVKLDGKPLEEGSILFSATDENVAGKVAGGSIKNGRYRLAGNAGPAIGMNHVEIHGIRRTGRSLMMGNNPMTQGAEEVEEAVAPQYNVDSTLQFEIKPGENTANFDVTSQ
jgi:hypothetical protein